MNILKSRYFFSTLLVIGVVGLVAFIVVTVIRSTQTKTSREYLIVIPIGTGDKIAAGEDPHIIPQEIQLTIGERDTLIIENHDVVGHTIGDFWVGAGETLRQKFRTPGVFRGQCTVHPAQQIQIIVNSKG